MTPYHSEFTSAESGIRNRCCAIIGLESCQRTCNSNPSGGLKSSGNAVPWLEVIEVASQPYAEVAFGYGFANVYVKPDCPGVDIDAGCHEVIAAVAEEETVPPSGA